jgi:putative ABC transport system permease protein
MMITLLQDVRYALRQSRKNPGFAAVAILTLALGIGATTVIFSVFYNLRFDGFAAKDPSQLVVPVIQSAEGSVPAKPMYISLSQLDAVREQNHVFRSIVGYSSSTIMLVGDGNQTYQFYDTRVTSDALEFYGVSPFLGRGIAPADGLPGAPPVFVMNYKTWQSSFNGDPKILGKEYTANGEPRTLVGIMPLRFQAYGSLPQIWIPITWTHDSQPAAQGSPDQAPQVALLARLKPGVTLQMASTDLDVIVKRLAVLHPNDFPKHFTASVESAGDFLMGPGGIGTAGGAGFDSDIKHLLYDLLVAALLLLLIACINVANLLLARATVREKEIAVRSALGATRARIVRQLLVESSILAMAACAAGCILAYFGMKIVATEIPPGWFGVGGEVSIRLNVPVLLFAVGIAALATLFCGLAPALHGVRGNLQPHLTMTGNDANSGFRHGKFRAALVIGEVALSIVLLIGGVLMSRSYFLLTHVDLGFNPRNVLVVGFMPPHGHDALPDREKMYSPQQGIVLQQAIERLTNLPGVASVAVQDTIPGYGPGSGPEVTVPGATHSEKVGFEGCDENLLQTLGLHLTEGRWLSSQDLQNAKYVAVINQSLARDFFSDKNPLGQQLKVKAFLTHSQAPQDATFEVIGVVRDVKNAGPQQPAHPMAFVPSTTNRSPWLLVKTKVEPTSMMHVIQQQIWAVDPDQVFWVFDPLQTFLHKLTYATPEFGLTMIAPLGGIALMLVIIGVFSSMAYTVALQTHEFGIRLALGAQQAQVLAMVIKKSLRLVSAGIVIGLFASYLLTRFIASQIWGIPARDPWTFGAVACVIVLVALAASYIPARRAAKVDPMVALRYE